MTTLSANRPSTNPQEDLFGHAPFAENLASSIYRYQGNDGLVLALYSLCSSGKSKVLSYVRHFLEHPRLGRLLVGWYPWGITAEAKTCCEADTSSNDGLLILLNKFCSHNPLQTVGDWTESLQPRLNSAWWERCIDATACALGLIDLRQVGLVPHTPREAVDLFLKEFEILKAGKNPDGVGAFDD